MVKYYTTWEDIRGNNRLISGMGTVHIINCLKKIRKEKWRLEYIETFENTISCRLKDYNKRPLDDYLKDYVKVIKEYLNTYGKKINIYKPKENELCQ